MTASRVAALLLSFATALPAAPAWQAELTSPAAGNFPKPPPSVLDYQLSWNGTVDSGRTRIEFAPPDAGKPGSYVIRSSSASMGSAAVVFPYQTHFWSEIDPATLRPKVFQAEESDRTEKVVTTVRHLPGKVESREVTTQLKTKKTKQTDRTFAFQPVFDVFSAMLHVRSQKLDNGDRIVLALHPFNSPYLMRVRVVGREVHNGRNAIRLTVGMRKISRKTMELQPYKKLKQDVTLWLSDDADRIPIELRAAVFIGDVRATLVSHRKP